MKMESWILKRLVSILNRAAKRPHVPRSRGMRELLKGCGIELSPLSVKYRVYFEFPISCKYIHHETPVLAPHFLPYHFILSLRCQQFV